ncbi:hypothetical protein [Parasphingorhabdus sp.]|uniref:hypothetical protein n=1 Tax=Parasphingorhabdus sp. TaxID=2709688 RepID=UPI003D2D49A8
MKLPFIDRIWRVKDSFPLDDQQSKSDVFKKLDPLFQTQGTSYQVKGDTLTFRKKNPAAQDKLATFTRGTLSVADREGRAELRYDLTSPALLACFLAPLLFLAFAQATVALGEYEKSKAEATSDSGKDAKKDEEEEKEIKLHPLDIALGAPEPKKPDEKDKDDKFSPTTAYVIAGIFAALYFAGRILEPWLIKSTFRKKLSDMPVANDANPSDQVEE